MNTEFDLIRRFFAESAQQHGRNEIVLGIGDDGALLDIPDDKFLCVATDVLVADTHFPGNAPPNLIAQKALAVNLSDMAAMGARPLCFSLGLTLPAAEESWLQRFAEGLFAVAADYDCPLIGGDTTQGPLAIAITIHGLAEKTKYIRRDGARPGDSIFVTGTLGDAALALPILGIQSHLGEIVDANKLQLSVQYKDHFENAYYQPQPRVEFACNSASLVSSGIDISDGLLGDLGHIIHASNTGAIINIDDLPFSEVAKSCAPIETLTYAALAGGDDYELCLTVAPQHENELIQKAKQFDISLYKVGEITVGDSISLLQGNGKEFQLAHAAFEHFK